MHQRPAGRAPGAVVAVIASKACWSNLKGSSTYKKGSRARATRHWLRACRQQQRTGPALHTAPTAPSCLVDDVDDGGAAGHKIALEYVCILPDAGNLQAGRGSDARH